MNEDIQAKLLEIKIATAQVENLAQRKYIHQAATILPSIKSNLNSPQDLVRIYNANGIAKMEGADVDADIWGTSVVIDGVSVYYENLFTDLRSLLDDESARDEEATIAGQ